MGWKPTWMVPLVLKKDIGQNFTCKYSCTEFLGKWRVCSLHYDFLHLYMYRLMDEIINRFHCTKCDPESLYFCYKIFLQLTVYLQSSIKAGVCGLHLQFSQKDVFLLEVGHKLPTGVSDQVLHSLNSHINDYSGLWATLVRTSCMDIFKVCKIKLFCCIQQFLKSSVKTNHFFIRNYVTTCCSIFVLTQLYTT